MRTEQEQKEIIEKIKQQIESDESFKYWNVAIGLSFEDFSILELDKDRNVFISYKEGKKDIGNYYVHIKGEILENLYFDMNNERVRENTLKRIIGLIS